jgi:L-threonylcarbamoyladenylate synthase
LIVHATEGVFGIGCSAFNRDACRAVAELKSRGRNKPFILVAADIVQIASWVRLDLSDFSVDRAGWPGPETWILPSKSEAPSWLRGIDRTIAVRISAHPQVQSLCRAVGPLVSTSANPPGRKPALCLLQARRYFGGRIKFYLPGRLINPGKASRIRDGRSGTLRRA